MECERFKKLLKSWYIQVQNEALAPARMVHFMEEHLAECPTCMMDPEARKDVQKIITLVLPQDKLQVASRSTRKTEEKPLQKEAEPAAADQSDDNIDDDIDNDDDDDDTDDDTDDEEDDD